MNKEQMLDNIKLSFNLVRLSFYKAKLFSSSCQSKLVVKAEINWEGEETQGIYSLLFAMISSH